MTSDQSLTDPLTKGERTRLQILEAANQLFSGQGFHGTSMRQIADRAGIALGSIYNHFESKEAIFTDVARHFHPIRTILPALEADEGGTVEEVIHHSADRMFSTLNQRDDFMNLLLIEAVEFKGAHFPSLFSEIFPRAVQFSQRLESKPGALRDDIPLPVMVATFIGMNFSFYLFQRLFGKLVDIGEPDQILHQMMEIYLHGIQPGERVMIQRLRSLIRKEFIQIKRDPRTLAMIIIIPVMQLFLLGYAATNDVSDVPWPCMTWTNPKHPRRPDAPAYGNAEYFLVTNYVSSEEELQKLIEFGEVRVGLLIPPDYSRSLSTGKPAQVGFVIDGSDPSIAKTALSTAQLIGQAHGAAIQEERLALNGMGGMNFQPVEVRTQVWYNPTLEDAYFMVPGIVGMVLFTLTSMVTANSIVRERERGTIEQLIVTPIRPWEMVLGKMVPYVILAFINTGEVLADRFAVVWRPHPRQPDPRIRAVRGFPDDQSGNRVAGLDDRQHPAGSHDDRLYDLPAIGVPLRFLFPHPGNAQSAAVDLLRHPAALLHEHHPGPAAQGCRHPRHAD